MCHTHPDAAPDTLMGGFGVAKCPGGISPSWKDGEGSQWSAVHRGSVQRRRQRGDPGGQPAPRDTWPAGVCWHGTSWLCNRTHLVFEQRAASVREGEGGEVRGIQEKKQWRAVIALLTLGLTQILTSIAQISDFSPGMSLVLSFCAGGRICFDIKISLSSILTLSGLIKGLSPFDLSQKESAPRERPRWVCGTRSLQTPSRLVLLPPPACPTLLQRCAVTPMQTPPVAGAYP